MNYNVKSTLSSGYTIGTIKTKKSFKSNIIKESIEIEKLKYENAIKDILIDLDNKELINSAIKDYLTIQRLMISDPLLKEAVFNKINEGLSVCDSIELTMNEFINPLKNSNDTYLKERVHDLEDVKSIIINKINNNYKENNDSFIYYTDILLPSDLINNENKIIGVISKNGGYTSHASILCRSLNIPYVILDEEFDEDDYVIIDTRINQIIKNPEANLINKYKEELKNKSTTPEVSIPHDGFLFLANANNLNDVKMAMESKFDGIGLYRTEFIFMNKDKPLLFENQYNIYKDAVEICKNTGISFRTFDMGTDKRIPYLKTYDKTLDTYLNNKEIFENQISAILKSNIYNNVRIMLPNISNPEEFETIRNWIDNIKEKNNYNNYKIGLNLETKEALEKIEEFSNLDFIAIGTNDLLANLYNIDRENNNIDYSLYIDDLISKLYPVINYCNKYDVCLSVCGELAAIKEYALKFYKAGIKNLSVSTSLIKELNLAYKAYKNE